MRGAFCARWRTPVKGGGVRGSYRSGRRGVIVVTIATTEADRAVASHSPAPPRIEDLPTNVATEAAANAQAAAVLATTKPRGEPLGKQATACRSKPLAATSSIDPRGRGWLRATAHIK